MRRQRQFEVAGELQPTAASGTIRNGYAPQLDIIVPGDGDIHDGFDFEGTALKLRVVRAKTHRTAADRAARGLSGYCPGGARLRVADIEKRAPSIAGRIGTPSGDVEFLPAAVARSGVGDHQPIASVSVQMNARNRRDFLPGPFNRFFTSRTTSR